MPKVPIILLVAVSLNAAGTGARSKICTGYCDDSHITFFHCTDNRSCMERVHKNPIIQVFASDQTSCYRETNPVFPAYVKSVSALINNETLSLSISWQWPAMDVADNSNDYEATWGLQYTITGPSESRSNCYTTSLSKRTIQQGKLNIPCMKFEDDCFPETVEFTVTSLMFVTEKLKYSSFFTPSRLQEITVKADKSGNGSPISVWNPEMTYKFSDPVLTVSFIPAPLSLGYTSYEVRIFNAEENRCSPGASYVDEVVTVPHWPTTVVNFSTKNYVECSKYCVGLHPIRNSPQANCSEGCVTEMRDMLVFQVPSQILKCTDWNATFILKRSPHQNEITVSFDVFPSYDSCFEKFHMDLFSALNSVCKPPFIKIASKVFDWNPSTVSIVTFEELAPGNYCVRVSPIHQACQMRNKDICSSVRSKVHYLAAPHAAASSMQTPESPVFNRVMIVSIVSVIGIVVVLTIGGILWRKTRPPPDLEIEIEIPSAEDRRLLEGACSNAPLEVIILCTHDEETRMKAKALYNFLVQCRGYQVFLVEYHREKIAVGNPCFVPNILSFSCPQHTQSTCHSNTKRIIVVKSRRAFRLFRKQEMIMRGIIQHDLVNDRNHNPHRPDDIHLELNFENDENLAANEQEPSNIYKELDEKFFCPAVTSIPTLTNSLMDTCHIFVVQFGDSMLPESETFRLLTPGQRYFLPRHLAELCLNLNRIDYPTDATVRSGRIKEMLQQWREHSSYRELIEAC